MIRLEPARTRQMPAIVRLSALAPLDPLAVVALETALGDTHTVRARRELVAEGSAIAERRIIASGWAARVRLLADGRRQFLSFLLPGDLLGDCPQPRPLAVTTIVTLTDVVSCPAPEAAPGTPLDEAYRISKALEEAYLLAQIARLGRLNAQERIADFLLELYERLSLAGLAEDGRFDLPLTQEIMADALGLTSVHVNRMLQQARREDELSWRSGRLTLRDPASLAARVGRLPAQVSEPL